MKKTALCTALTIALLTSCGDTTGPVLPTYIMWGGFESGTMLRSQTPAGDWDGLTEVNGAMYMSGQSHTGDWAVEASVSDTCATPSWGAYLERAFDYDSDTLYARTWFMLMDDNNFSGVPGRGFEFMRLCDSQMETVCSFEIAYFDLSTMMFVTYLTNGPGGLETVTRNYGVGMGTGIWYYLEVAVVRDSISGSFTVWLGEEGEDPWMIPYTGVDNLTGIDLDNFCVGIVDTGGDATGSMRFDDYALSTSRIGSGS